MSRRRPADGQMDLLALVEEHKLEQPAPGLFGSPARGLAARSAELEAWVDVHGRRGSLHRSHAWSVAITCPDTPTDTCQPTVLTVDLRCEHWHADCCCVGDLLYRGACRHCEWEGKPCEQENQAAEDAHDHAWPGWRTLPVVRRVPDERTARARWIERVSKVYPPGWIEAGGPILTYRRPPGTRHVPNHTPFGGYDLAATDNTDNDTDDTGTDGTSPAEDQE